MVKSGFSQQPALTLSPTSLGAWTSLIGGDEVGLGSAFKSDWRTPRLGSNDFPHSCSFSICGFAYRAPNRQRIWQHLFPHYSYTWQGFHQPELNVNCAMLRGSILAASLVVPKESEMEMGNGDGDGDGNGKRGKSSRGEDVCPTTTGFTIGQLVLFSVFPLLSHLATRAIFRRCPGVNRIIWAVNEYGRVGHDRYVTVMLMTLMSRKRGHQLAEINDDKCPQMLPQLGVDAFKSINAAGKCINS